MRHIVFGESDTYPVALLIKTTAFAIHIIKDPDILRIVDVDKGIPEQVGRTTSGTDLDGFHDVP